MLRWIHNRCATRCWRAIALVGCLLAEAGSGGLRVRGQAPSGSGVRPKAEAATEAKGQPAYDVVTIRPNNEGQGGVSINTNDNVFQTTNTSLLNLLQHAYHLQPELILGGPKWVDSARFDVHAKMVDVSAEDLKKLKWEDYERMAQALLADRFHLQVHTEVRTLPVYELVVAKGGPKVKEVSPESRNDPFHGVSSGGMSIHNGNLTAHYRSMESFAETLSSQVHRTVLNKTGLPGMYNFQMNWSREDAAPSEDTTLPSIFVALEDQLGLRLVPAKGPVKTLVIDHAELPSADEN